MMSNAVTALQGRYHNDRQVREIVSQLLWVRDYAKRARPAMELLIEYLNSGLSPAEVQMLSQECAGTAVSRERISERLTIVNQIPTAVLREMADRYRKENRL